MADTAAPGCRYALGLALTACLVLGGGTASGLAIDALLQVLVILCATFVLLRQWDTPVSRIGLVFFWLIFGAGILQLIPLPTGLMRLFRPDVFLPLFPGAAEKPGATTISLTASRTVLSVIFALVPVYFFLAASRLSASDLVGLIPFYLAGVLYNLVAAVLQFSLSSGGAGPGLLGYEVAAGVFANVNHFSTLLFSSIPVIIYIGVFLNRRIFAATVLLLIFLALLAAGSRAGILIGVAISGISIASLAWRERKGGILALVLMVLLAAYSYGAIARIEERSLADPEFGRPYFALATLEGIRENWLFGVGYGAFQIVFPHYEHPGMIQNEYVNHAHNDFLEVVFEGGVLGAVILVLYVLALVRRGFEVSDRPLQRLVTLSIVMVLIHSMVDYPLRTMAVAMAFAFFNALLFSDASPEPVSRRHRASRGHKHRRRRRSTSKAAA